MTISVDLKLHEVAWLAQVYSNHSAISPFSYIKGGRFCEKDRDALIERGIITSQGAVAGKYAPLFDCVSSADAFTSIELSSGPIKIKAATLRRDTMSVAMTAHDEILRWAMPANVEAIAAVLEDYIGVSSLKNVELTLELTLQGATLLGLLCDIYRKQVLSAMAKDEFFQQSGLTLNSICFYAHNTGNCLQSLRVKIEKLYSECIVLDRKAVEEALSELKNKGVVAIVEDKWYLTGPAAMLAGSMLVWDNILSLKFGCVDNGVAFATEAFAIQAGVHDILYIEQRPTGIWFSTLSPSALLQVIREVL